MNTSIAALLQVALALIMSAQKNTTLSSTTKQQLITLGSQTIQLATQAGDPPSFAVTPDNTIYPGYTDLLNSPYLDASGTLVPLGATVKLDDGDLSFGDLNGDGLDDAAVLVQKTDATGATSIALAAMLNQGGILYNIADLSLGTGPVTVYSHQIADGGDIVMNMQIGTAPAVTSTYQLIGDTLLKIESQ